MTVDESEEGVVGVGWTTTRNARMGEWRCATVLPNLYVGVQKAFGDSTRSLYDRHPTDPTRRGNSRRVGRPPSTLRASSASLERSAQRISFWVSDDARIGSSIRVLETSSTPPFSVTSICTFLSSLGYLALVMFTSVIRDERRILSNPSSRPVQTASSYLARRQSHGTTYS